MKKVVWIKRKWPPPACGYGGCWRRMPPVVSWAGRRCRRALYAGEPEPGRHDPKKRPEGKRSRSLCGRNWPARPVSWMWTARRLRRQPEELGFHWANHGGGAGSAMDRYPVRQPGAAVYGPGGSKAGSCAQLDDPDPGGRPPGDGFCQRPLPAS